MGTSLFKRRIRMKNTDWSKLTNQPYHPIINFFIQKFNYQSYLELGVRDKTNTFNHINCIKKEGVDIDDGCQPTHLMTTDDYFSSVGKDVKWDIIFIDASHEKNQVLKDFNNSLEHLNENGTIIMDDINPFFEELLQEYYCHNEWEVFANLRGTRPDLDMHGIYSSFCGIVRRGQQKTHNLDIQPTFDFLNKHRMELINILSWDEIIAKYE
jgi:hypothetical protein